MYSLFRLSGRAGLIIRPAQNRRVDSRVQRAGLLFHTVANLRPFAPGGTRRKPLTGKTRKRQPEPALIAVIGWFYRFRAGTGLAGAALTRKTRSIFPRNHPLWRIGGLCGVGLAVPFRGEPLRENRRNDGWAGGGSCVGTLSSVLLTMHQLIRGRARLQILHDFMEQWRGKC
jgi:hypothetical protein